MKSKGAENDCFIKNRFKFIPVYISFILVDINNFSCNKYGLEDTGKGEEKWT